MAKPPVTPDATNAPNAPARPRHFTPWPDPVRPWQPWQRERWLPPAPKPPPDLEVHEPPPISAEELEELLAEAKEAGAAEARADLEAELASLKSVTEELGPALEELARLRHATLLAAAEDVADIVRLFATKIVGDSLALHPEALPKLVREALGQLPEQDEVTIACSPQSAESMSRHLESGLRERLVVDPELGSGVVVKTRNASLDATLSHAESALETAIQNWLSEQWWVGGDP